MDTHQRTESIESWADYSPTAPLFPSSKSDQPLKYSYGSSSRRRHQLVLALAFVSLLSITGFLAYVLPAARLAVPEAVAVTSSSRLRALRGPPTARFRDNLRNDTKYITSWISAGWTNDVMTYANLIYLGLITGRVPIIHTFLPSHVWPAEHVPVGDVFDLDYLSERIGIPVLQWLEVKNSTTTGGETEELGCISVWQAVQSEDPNPRVIPTEAEQGLDISFTTAPDWIKTLPGNPNDKFARLWDIATLAFPGGRKWLGTPQPSHSGAVASPDQHLTCFDYLYYTCASIPDEFIYEHSPVWRDVLTHMRFTPRMQNLADGYLRRMFNVAESNPIPPYITIHARHGDFGRYCEYANLTISDCFPHMDDYAIGIAGIRTELEERLGVSPTHVVVVSDEKDPAWWKAVELMGWYTPNHESEQTVTKYGSWYPVFIDAVIQASGVGFLGSPGSTMSIIAGRRVIDWQNGVYHNAPWVYSHTPGGPALL